MKVIAITGTPGTGKSALAKELSLLLHYPVIDVSSFIRQHRINEGYDQKRQCSIVDPCKLNKALMKAIKGIKTQNTGINGVIIDSFLSHFLPVQYVKLCIVTKCSLKVLEKRLTSKGYSQVKVRENLDAEIFDVCLVEAEQKKHNVLVVDTTKKSSQKLAKEIAKLFLPKNA